MLTINPVSIPPFFSSILILAISIYILLINRRSPIHQAFFYFCLSLFIWLGCYSLVYSAKTDVGAYFWVKMSFFGVAFIPLTNFYFYVKALNLAHKKGFLFSLFSIVVVFITLNMTTPYVYSGTQTFFWGYYSKAAFLHTVFLIHWVAVWMYGLYLVYNKMQEYKASGDFLSYNRAKYLYIAYLGETLGFVDFLPKYGLPIYPFGYFSTVYWITIASFVLIRHKRLSDISVVTRRVLIVSAMSAFVISIFCASYLIHETLQKYSIPLNTAVLFSAVSLLIGLTFQPIYFRIKRTIDKVFFPEYYDRKERLAKLGEDILSTKDIVQFNRLILESIFNLFKITKSTLYVKSGSENIFVVQAESGWGKTTDSRTTTPVQSNDEIVCFLRSNPYLIAAQIKHMHSPEIDTNKLLLSMAKLEATLAIPIISGNEFLGFFLLGDKESGLPYDSTDLSTLKVLANHTAAALNNIELHNRWNSAVTQKQQMDKVLHRYMSRSIADEVLSKVEQEQDHEWKGQRMNVSILVADLRGFTSTTENHSPEDIVEWLNEYLSAMVEIIMSHGGTIDKFMGDGVLVVFGAPNALENHELHAVKCALDMQSKLISLNSQRLENNLVPLQMGIAIAAGDVVSGNIGSDKRMEYTVIGDPVNLASRLQSAAGPGQILATTNVVEKNIEITHKLVKPLVVRGKTKPVDVVEILSIKPKFDYRREQFG